MNMLSLSDVRIVPVWLACRIGLPKAIILKQAHYLMENEYNKQRYAERVWFKRGVDAWRESLPFWSKRTIERHLSDLEADGLLLSTTDLNRIDRAEIVDGYYQFDHTKWYTVVMEHKTLNVDDDVPEDTAVDDNVTHAPDKTADGSSPANLSNIDDSLSLISDKVADCSSTNELKKKGNAPKVADVISQAEKKVDRGEELEEVRKHPDHGPTLSRFWRSGLSAHGLAHGTQPEMSIADQKMLKTLVKALPDVQMLETVLANWTSFQTFARDEFDVKLPVRPRVQNVAHLREAITEFQQHADTADGWIKDIKWNTADGDGSN